MQIQDIFKISDFTPTIYAQESFGSRINRGEIEQSLIDAGYDMPQHDLLFYIIDTNRKCFLVRYLADIDKYAIERLSLK